MSTNMRVAIIGSGAVTRYFAEELPAAGIDVIILTRSIKSQFENHPSVQQFVTDYSAASPCSYETSGSVLPPKPPRP